MKVGIKCFILVIYWLMFFEVWDLDMFLLCNNNLIGKGFNLLVVVCDSVLIFWMMLELCIIIFV